MKYIVFNESSQTIVKTFNTLRELMNEYPDIDVSDFVDDLETAHEGNYILSSSYLWSMLLKIQNNENDSSLKDIISLREDLDEMSERYNQANMEIENVHKEYVEILNKNTSNEEKIKEFQEKVSEHEKNEANLKMDVSLLNTDIEELKVKNRIDTDNLRSVSGSEYANELLEISKTIVNQTLEVRKELTAFKEGSLHV